MARKNLTKAMSRPPFDTMMLERGKGARKELVPNSSYGKLDVAYNQFLALVDPLGDSKAAVAVRIALEASPDMRFQGFLNKILSNVNYSLAAAAKVQGISLAEFHRWWRHFQDQYAVHKACDEVVLLVDDLARDSKTTEVPCGRCDALGVINHRTKEGKETSRPCPACKGTGKELRIGDDKARRQLSDISGHTGPNKNGGAAVQIVQNFGTIESRADKLSQIKFDMTEDFKTVEVEP